MLGRFEYVKAVRVCASLPISVNLPIMKVGLFELCCCWLLLLLCAVHCAQCTHYHLPNFNRQRGP